jgi:hypothetical protein
MGRCMWKGGVVQEVVIVDEEKGEVFRYVLCSPSFWDSCERYIAYLREAGIDFVKVSTTEKEYVDQIVSRCYATGHVIFG